MPPGRLAHMPPRGLHLLVPALALATELSPEPPSNEYADLSVWASKLGPFSGRFAGQRVLVTGGSSGIGLAAVLGFRQECADVVFAGSSATKAEATHRALSGLPAPSCPGQRPPTLAWATGNVANATEATALVDGAIASLGGLDVAVNCAGMAGVPGVQVGEERILELLGSAQDPHSVNVYGMLYSMHAEVRHWLGARQRGAIVNVGSLCGEHAGICGTMYTSSKFATQGFSRQAAIKYAPHGIRVNVVDPGLVNTQMLRDDYGKHLGADHPQWLEERKAVDSAIPLRRIAEPWELAGPILFLADAGRASYVTGTTLTADGALTQVGAFNSEAAAVGSGHPDAAYKAEL